jgi:hypothetical protein
MPKNTFKIKKSKSNGDPIRKVGKDTRKKPKQTNKVTSGMHGEAFTVLSKGNSSKIKTKKVRTIKTTL